MKLYRPATCNAGRFLKQVRKFHIFLNVDLFSPDHQKVGIFLTKFSLKNLVVNFVVSNFAAYSMTYTFTGSLASDDKKRRKPQVAAIVSMPLFN